MDEQNSKKGTPKKNKSTRPLSDPANGIQQTKEEEHARRRDGGQSDHYMWGLSWAQFVTIILSFLGAIIAIITVGLRWHTDMLLQTRTQQKERARIVLSDIRDIRIEPDPAFAFSLIFKNVGETTALNTYGTRLQGECPYTSSQECVQWCVDPLREERGDSYGHLVPQDEYKEEVFYIFKTGRARKKVRAIYFCGYFAYTDVFCMWRRKFYVLSYDSSTEVLSPHILSNDEEEAEVENCSPWRLY